MRVRMGDGDSPLILIGDACRGLSDNGRHVSEARLDVSIERRGVDGGVEVLNGRWDVDAEARALTEDGTTRTRFVGDLERIGLEARRAEGTRAFGVGVSGGVDTSLSVLVGVIASRGHSRSNEGVDGDGGNFDDGWRDNKGSLGLAGEPCLETGTLISGNWRWTFLVLCRVGEMRTSVLEEEEPGVADCDFGDGRAWDDVCKAGDDIDANRNDGVI